MKNSLLSALFTLCTCLCKGQFISIPDKPKYEIVNIDTINIRGIVYDAAGKPAPSIFLTSTNKEIVYSGYNLYTVTDAQGRFELKGALVKDTINIHSWAGDINLINNGSRYLEITLPASKNFLIKSPIQVFATRKYKKSALSKFKVIKNANIADYYGVAIEKLPNFPHGNEKFIEIIKGQLNYPEKAIANNIEGDVEIGFTIERDGILTNFKVLRGIGYDCEEQVIDAIKKFPHWVPAVITGRPIATQSSITINFKLTDK